MSTVSISADQAKELTRKALGTAIVKNRSKVVALLKKYGVAVDGNYSDDELIVGVLQAIRSDTRGRFKNDLVQILGETVTLNFTADAGQGFFNWVNVGTAGATAGATATPAATTKEKSALGQALASNAGNILTTGLGLLSNSLTGKSNQKLADTALQIEAEKTKQAALQAAAAGAGGAGLGAKPGLSTGAIIGISLAGVAILGTIIYFVVKK